MALNTAAQISNELADAAERAASGVVQVHGERRRPASGLVYDADVVLTTMGALGREDNLHVRRADGQAFEAQLAGWDPATSLAVLRVSGLEGSPLPLAESPARVGQLALAIARSWSNALTASLGIVSVIGGPLRTGRRREIAQVLRTTAPMHGGFAGGAFVDTSGALLGVATAAAIRGLGVVIPSSIAWSTAAHLLEHGRRKRGYLGIAVHAVSLAETQRAVAGREDGVLVTNVGEASPAAGGGLLVGDVLVAFEGQVVASPEDLLGLLDGATVGREAQCQVLRGSSLLDLKVVVGERHAS